MKEKETGLETQQREQTNELTPTAGATAAQSEIQSAIIVAKRLPRDEEAARTNLLKTCERPRFAEQATYLYERGGKPITGPSVNLAREGARNWGNIQYGCDIVSDSKTHRQIRGWAWDLQTNTKTTAEDNFQKVIFRKKGGWQEPDERDLRELTNRKAAILVRNCILYLLPRDIVEEAMEKARATTKTETKKDLPGRIRKMIETFGKIGIKKEDLEKKLQHPIEKATADEITSLGEIFNSIEDGNSTIPEEFPESAVAGKQQETNGTPQTKTEKVNQAVDDRRPTGQFKGVPKMSLAGKTKKGDPKRTVMFDHNQGYTTTNEEFFPIMDEASGKHSIEGEWRESVEFGREIITVKKSE